MYTERKIHGGFIGTIFLIATFVLFFFHTRPAQNELRARRADVAVLQNDVDALSVEKTELTPAGTLSEVEQKDLDQAIPQGVQQDVIITDLNRMAKTADVTFNALTFSLQQNKTLPTVEISAGFQGVSGNIIRFLKMVETNSRKFVVKDAGVTRAESAGGLELMNLNLTLQAFYR